MLLEGISIVEQYNVVQYDGSRPTIAALDHYDLLALLFTSKSEPATLKPCIADLIKNRIRLGKPTWIYSPARDKLAAAKEYSEDLSGYFESFLPVDLSTRSGFKGFTVESSEEYRRQKAQSIQDILGSN
jgi:hypothetical protein